MFVFFVIVELLKYKVYIITILTSFKCLRNHAITRVYGEYMIFQNLTKRKCLCVHPKIKCQKNLNKTDR